VNTILHTIRDDNRADVNTAEGLTWMCMDRTLSGGGSTTNKSNNVKRDHTNVSTVHKMATQDGVHTVLTATCLRYSSAKVLLLRSNIRN
jgi:hypothetical protein